MNTKKIWILFESEDGYNSTPPQFKAWWSIKPSNTQIQTMFSKKCTDKFIIDILNDKAAHYQGYNYWLEESIEGDHI